MRLPDEAVESMCWEPGESVEVMWDEERRRIVIKTAGEDMVERMLEGDKQNLKSYLEDREE